MEVKKPDKTLEFDPERCNEMFEELVEVFQKHRPTVGEIIVAYGNLGYTLGASVNNYKGKGPGIEQLKELYYKNPGDIGIALMLQGLTVTTWYGDWEQLQLGTEDNDKEG